MIYKNNFQSYTNTKSFKSIVKLFGIVVINLLATCQVYAIDQLKYDQINQELFIPFVNFIDTNIGVFVLLISAGGALTAEGDLGTRAKGAVMGMITALIIWSISKKIVGF